VATEPLNDSLVEDMYRCLKRLCDELYEARYDRGWGPLPCCYDALDAYERATGKTSHVE
jgi:hypothetical protein